MTWLVRLTHNLPREATYTGPRKGRRLNEWREFDDLPSAHRWARDQVETGYALIAAISEVN